MKIFERKPTSTGDKIWFEDDDGHIIRLKLVLNIYKNLSLVVGQFNRYCLDSKELRKLADYLDKKTKEKKQ